MKLLKPHFGVLALILLIAICCINGCADEKCTEDLNAEQRPTGLKYAVSGLPQMADFSDTTYEDYRIHFPQIERATVRSGDIEIPIVANDPRLIRLLNFLAFSMNNGYTSWRQGYVTKDEINTYLECKDAMLEIWFLPEDVPKNNTHSKTQRMILCGDSYMLFLSVDSTGEVCGERYWPYSTLYPVRHDSTSAENNEWGNHFWIDLLTYAGF